MIDFLDGRATRPHRVQAAFGISDGTIALQNLIRDGDGDPTEGLFKRGVLCDYRPSANAIAETSGGFGFSYVEVLWSVKHIDKPEPGWASCFDTTLQRIRRGYEVDPTDAVKKLGIGFLGRQ